MIKVSLDFVEDSAYDFEHVHKATRTAPYLAKEEEADPELAQASSRRAR
ncbi:MAG: hypothetical protein JSV27_05815 [Candidatus Bathyarchaeota archaeon]|nr:MAG: hypothetical protein JSV27_05815 [Candidatus Bathyarchaeota archaeon]